MLPAPASKRTAWHQQFRLLFTDLSTRNQNVRANQLMFTDVIFTVMTLMLHLSSWLLEVEFLMHAGVGVNLKGATNERRSGTANGEHAMMFIAAG